MGSTGHGDSNSGKKKQCNWWCAVCGGQYEWRAPNRVRVVQLEVNANEARVLEAHAAPLGLCDNLINELMKYGDGPIQSIVTGLMDGLRSCIRADNRSHLRQGTRQLHVQNPNFRAFPPSRFWSRDGVDSCSNESGDHDPISFVSRDSCPPSSSGSPPVCSDVAFHLTSVAIIEQLVRGRGCWVAADTHWRVWPQGSVARLVDGSEPTCSSGTWIWMFQ